MCADSPPFFLILPIMLLSRKKSYEESFNSRLYRERKERLTCVSLGCIKENICKQGDRGESERERGGRGVMGR